MVIIQATSSTEAPGKWNVDECPERPKSQSGSSGVDFGAKKFLGIFRFARGE